MQEGAVGRPAAHDDAHLLERRGAGGRAPRSGRRPTAMTLAIIESYSGGIASPSENPVSTRIPGPVGRLRSSTVPGRGREAALGVLGVDARLDGVARGPRRVALETTARGDVELELHQVEAGRHLGHRVLHLEARVDLEEGERRARPAGRGTRRCRRCGSPAASTSSTEERRSISSRSGGRTGRGRLLDQLLAAALDGAVAHADAPSRCRGRRRRPAPRRGGRPRTSRSIRTLASPNARRASSRARPSAEAQVVRRLHDPDAAARRRRRPP